MAKFFVGQRVRIVNITQQPTSARNGMEGVVISVVPGRTNYQGDARPYGVSAGGEDDWIFAAEQLEPLTPPKRQETIEWSEAIFTRDGQYREPVVVGRAA